MLGKQSVQSQLLCHLLGTAFWLNLEIYSWIHRIGPIGEVLILIMREHPGDWLMSELHIIIYWIHRTEPISDAVVLIMRTSFWLADKWTQHHLLGL